MSAPAPSSCVVVLRIVGALLLIASVAVLLVALGHSRDYLYLALLTVGPAITGLLLLAAGNALAHLEAIRWYFDEAGPPRAMTRPATGPHAGRPAEGQVSSPKPGDSARLKQVFGPPPEPEPEFLRQARERRAQKADSDDSAE